MNLSTLHSLLTFAAGRRVACIGDLMIDCFVYGDVTRVSPEAPVPVLSRSREFLMLGGAGNVARNVDTLGGLASLVALIGSDPQAHEAVRLLENANQIEAHLVVDPTRATTVKTRFVSGGQHLLRADSEHCHPATGQVEEDLIHAVEEACRGAGVILLSDYGKGAITDRVVVTARDIARKNGARLIVDSKARSFGRYGSVDLLKPNAAELANAVDLPTSTDPEVERALLAALGLWDTKAILVTRAAKGISLAQRGMEVEHFPTLPREVFDASGAGDTTLAALGLALAAGAALGDAIEFAQIASGVAVSKAGTATVTQQECLDSVVAANLAPAEGKVATVDRMNEEVKRWRAQGLKVGFTNGCFDIIHRGHVAYLAQARSWCDRLIVGINTDRSVRSLKGAGRPINELESRAVVLGALASVDLVVPFDERTPLALIVAAKPDVLVKGAEYTEDQIVGSAEVKAYGGLVKLATMLKGQSSSAIIAKMEGDRALDPAG
jgi:D-beta-D-heptose 7-phosphate kinase/D-beta-D-heptose 1-phosphate adenosyltransferase